MQRAEYRDPNGSWLDHNLFNTDHSDETRIWLTEQIWRCPHCQALAHTKLGIDLIWHFAHKALAETCPLILEGSGDYAPESQQHLAMKEAVLSKMRTDHPKATVKAEVRVSEARRIADVLVTFPGPHGERIAFECQWSMLSFDEFKERTNSYTKAGVQVIWIFPDKDQFETHRAWLRQNYIPHAMATAFVER